MAESLARTASIMALLLSGCAASHEHEEIISAEQGRITYKRVEDPAPPAPVAVDRPLRTGPTERELEQQRRISQLEAQQKTLQTEIQKLKND